MIPFFRGHVGASEAIHDLLLLRLLPYNSRRSRFDDGRRQVFRPDREAGTVQTLFTVSKPFAPSSVFSQQFQKKELKRGHRWRGFPS
jgi:hypothetical protein